MRKIDICSDCGKLAQLTNKVCPICLLEENRMMEKVRTFLRKNRGADFLTTVTETGVPETKIRKFIEEGRIIATPNLLAFKCKICEAGIKSGSLCEKCSQDMKSTPSDNNDLFKKVASHAKAYKLSK